MTDSAGWRVLIDPGAKGAWNMAVDEAILDRYAATSAPLKPTLRLYGFRPPALSLGRLQKACTSHDPRFLRNAGIELVRRPTGGNAVLHHQERTYAVVGRLREPPFEGGVVETYREIAACLVQALRRLGAEAEMSSAEPREPPERRRDEAACFALLSSHEITYRGRKMIGSAQLRRHGAFLQHGSIPLRADAAMLSGALGVPVPPESFTDLTTACGSVLHPGRLDSALQGAFSEGFGDRLVPGTLQPTEARRATRLYAWKYCSTAWTYDGRVGARESERVRI